MIRPITGCLFLLMTLGFGGCKVFLQTPDETTFAIAPAGWDAHLQNVSEISQWQVVGKVGVRSETKGESFNIEWDQIDGNFKIRLFGPLGLGMVTINQSPEGIEVLKGDERYSAQTLDELLDRLPFNIPVDLLGYWVRGIPAPDTQSGPSQFNVDGLLQSFNQMGWQVNYNRYDQYQLKTHNSEQTTAISLPNKIVLQKPPLKIKLAIRSWQIQS